jgi:hypothetical protein
VASAALEVEVLEASSVLENSEELDSGTKTWLVWLAGASVDVADASAEKDVADDSAEKDELSSASQSSSSSSQSSSSSEQSSETATLETGVDEARAAEDVKEAEVSPSSGVVTVEVSSAAEADVEAESEGVHSAGRVESDSSFYKREERSAYRATRQK